MDLSDSSSSNDGRSKKKHRKEKEHKDKKDKKSKKVSLQELRKIREVEDAAAASSIHPDEEPLPDAAPSDQPPPAIAVDISDSSDEEGMPFKTSSAAGDDGDDDEDDSFLEQLVTKAKESVRAHAQAKVALSAAFIASELRKEDASVPSTALVVVDASHEAQDVEARITRRKLMAPPKEDLKALRRLMVVNHSAISYLPFDRDFYIPPSDMRALSDTEVRDLLKQLDGAKVRGSDIPKPMRAWSGTGLNDAILDLLEEKKFPNPFAVQCIGIPILMSGRDVLVTAKTGSGKTLSYLLPAIRHAAHQPRCLAGEGPIVLVLVPTLELAVQVAAVAVEFAGRAGLRVVASHAGTPLHDNILQSRAGCDVMIATPGRLLDLATLSTGRVLSFRRITFVVVDEADRMFDSGFEEHVTRFLKNVRPDRQTAFISATLPKELKKTLLGLLSNPVEISVGGRPTPASNVTQSFYFFDESVYDVEADKGPQTKDPRFMTLLHVLAEEGLEHLILIFVQRKEECDELFGNLTACGYGGRIAVLHNGMDKLDREFALEKYKIGQQHILVATGVAERGLDISNLDLVVNYTMADHYEAYIHRIGRTGRAGKTGRAVSFFTRIKDDPIAGDLCDGLERAGSTVPDEMHERAKVHREKVKAGTAQHRSSYVKGYKRAKRQRFEDRDRMREEAKAAGLDEFLSDESFEHTSTDESEPEIVEVNESASAPSNAVALYKGGSLVVSRKQEDSVAQALERARNETDAYTNPESTKTFKVEYPINDLADPIRKRLQAIRKEVEAATSTTIISKGVFFDPRMQRSHTMRAGEVKLHLLIIGRTPEAVRLAVEKFEETKKEVKERERQKGSRVGAVL
jgi:ATP-dependent RNA helicase DDX46/PRP5